MLTLYDDIVSPHESDVCIAPYEKGISFERVRALRGDGRRTDFLHVNTWAEVPARREGGGALYDSTIVAAVDAARTVVMAPVEKH
jgi:glutathione S-transferase